MDSSIRATSTEDVRGEEIVVLKEEYFNQIERFTPQEIRSTKLFDLNDPSAQRVRLSKESIKEWRLVEWLANYRKEAAVSTGGIRGPQNVLYPWDYRYPLNQLGVALATLAKAMVLHEDIRDREINKICSGEVRYNTDDYIKLIKRIQAAQQIRTHLPIGGQRTSIWMTSFLIFMLDYDGGEYITSSHAISSKIATKDLDNQGSQFTPDVSARFVQKIEKLLSDAETKEIFIELADESSELIVEDFDGFDLYLDYLRKGIATQTNLDLIRAEIDNGFEVMYECVGGCMYRVMLTVFQRLGIERAFVWNNIQEDPFFHGVGKTMLNPVSGNREFFDYGCDTTIKEVVETLGYQKLLLDKPVGYIIIMVDPDGDRIVLGQIEPRDRKASLDALGVSYFDLENGLLFAFYMPNQSFLLTLDFHATQLIRANLWDNHPRFIITTTPSAASWVEWARKNRVNVIYVPVGFKEIAHMMKKVESEMLSSPNGEIRVHDIFGTEVNLGVQPRLLFAGEESGGMITGPEEPVRSRNGRIALAMREKSAGEASVLVAAMAADLYRKGLFLSDYLSNVFEKYEIKRRYDIRQEVRFYNESNPDPEALRRSKAQGEKQRDMIDNFYLSIALSYRDRLITMEQAKEILTDALPELNFARLEEIAFVGDGVFFEFSDKFVEIRKSGTDAIIKSYSAGEDKAECVYYAKSIAAYTGLRTPLFNKYIAEETYQSCQQYARRILADFQKGV
ncbi:MAG: hypothetical protein JXA30_00825 [Deltaproteobacteria bacterium]|nr:hypothetical protein [Deltaproteobacteria bacterium]